MLVEVSVLQYSDEFLCVSVAADAYCGCQMMLEWSDFSMGTLSTACNKSMRTQKVSFEATL